MYNLIMIIVTLIIYVVLIGVLSLYYYKRSDHGELWAWLGLKLGFWQGIVLTSIGFTTLTLFVFKWTKFIIF